MASSTPKPPTRKRSTTQELFQKIMERFDEMDKRMKHLEGDNVLLRHEIVRHTQNLAALNQRCLAQIGSRCPLDDGPEPNGDGEGS